MSEVKIKEVRILVKVEGLHLPNYYIPQYLSNWKAFPLDYINAALENGASIEVEIDTDEE